MAFDLQPPKDIVDLSRVRLNQAADVFSDSGVQYRDSRSDRPYSVLYGTAGIARMHARTPTSTCTQDVASRELHLHAYALRASSGLAATRKTETGRGTKRDRPVVAAAARSPAASHLRIQRGSG
jgi:hypothetical protein